MDDKDRCAPPTKGASTPLNTQGADLHVYRER